MDDKLCRICNKVFTRKWNLDRHLEDIHKIHTKQEIQNMNSTIDNNHNPAERFNNSNHIFRHRDNYEGMNQINYSGNYNNYNEIPQNYSYPENYYGQNYPLSNFNLQSEKELKRWTYDDQIQLQRGLKILQNHLERFYPQQYVSALIFMLRRRCNYEKSDESLKKYFIQMNIGDMWPW